MDYRLLIGYEINHKSHSVEVSYDTYEEQQEGFEWYLFKATREEIKEVTSGTNKKALGFRVLILDDEDNIIKVGKINLNNRSKSYIVEG
ncbi:MAG: hypothetical protein ACLTDM_15235 [Clostridium butyricum]